MMFRRTFNRLTATCALFLFAALCPRVATHAAEPGTQANGIDVEQRKSQQAWLWHPPGHVPPPPVRDTRWAQSAVDQFVLARLEAAAIKPSPRTDDRSWLRRVHFALTGLPPSLAESREFLTDGTPGARAHAVDRLLASPHFGERWARHWMDLMRYAESRGHESDFIIANAWHYRDYLIRAFNEDVPFNQFLSEHLAGDLLTPPRLRPGTDINESVLGTGWAFLGEEVHSPVDIRQDECERIDNKVDVFSKSFLGLTISCARCHDHKFDPIRSEDYYALAGFMLSSSFRQVRFEAMENNRQMAAELRELRRSHLPNLARHLGESRLAGVSDVTRYALAARDIAFASDPTAALPETAKSAALDPARLDAWLGQLRSASTNALHPLHALARPLLTRESGWPTMLSELQRLAARPAGAQLPEGARIVADYSKEGSTPWKVDGEAFGHRPLPAGELLAGSSADMSLAGAMPYGAARRDPFWNRLRGAPGNENDSGLLAATARAGQMLRTPTFTLGNGRLHYLIRGRTLVYAAVDSHLMVEGPLHRQLVQRFDTGDSPQPRWVTHDLSPYSGHRAHLEFGPDGEAGLEILMVVEAAQPPVWNPLVLPLPTTLQSASDAAKALQTVVQEACLALRGGTLAGHNPGTLAVADWVIRNPALFRGSPSSEPTKAVEEFLKAQQTIAGRVRWESRTAVSWFDGTGVDENVLVRGKPFKPAAVSPRALPAAFGNHSPLNPSASSGRAELARQLVDPSNPLVARTFVNRVWHHVFGRGIVASVDNFGALGEKPTHPELLDHLAWQFVHEDQWSLKRLLRRLVLTETFAMSSRMADPQTEERDPANALLHRMPIRRLEGEALRDALLSVSGRLNPAVGGPPVPVHLTEFIVGRGRPDVSGPLDGNGRRSIYTAVRRNFLPTLMQTFDSPTPFSTVGRRNVTNVPGQYLALMNDELFHQQAGVWAGRLLAETLDASDTTRIQWLFETAYGRTANSAEIQACLVALAEFTELRGLANSQGGVGWKPDVWTDLCHALLNANDFIYVR